MHIFFRFLRFRDGHNVSSSNHHHTSKANMMSNKSHGAVQSRTSSSSVAHKNYQQPPHGMQQNMHYQNIKENRDSSSQNFQSSSTKDCNFLKQHPPHTERDGSKESGSFHGQYPQNSSVHQNYPHKSESNYSGTHPHRDSSRGNHGNQTSGSSVHHSQHLVGNNMNITNQRDYSVGNQRDSLINKEGESQMQAKDAMSSSIRDIISQSVSQKDLHSTANERKEHPRDKSRMNYVHGNTSSSNFRTDCLKSVREQPSLNYHESSDRKTEEFSKVKDKSFKKGEEEPMIDIVKLEANLGKTEKFDETDIGDDSWNISAKSEKSNILMTHSGKNEHSVENNKMDPFFSNLDSNRSSGHSKIYDSKYKTHHYHSSSKNCDVPLTKVEKAGSQCSSDVQKKISDRGHEKHRKIQEHERISHSADGSGNIADSVKHHKIGKELSEKNKMILSSQNELRMKEKLSPSKYQKMKSMSRPSNFGFVKTESGHFSLDVSTNISASDGERSESTSSSLMSLKPIGLEETNKNIGNAANSQKQKGHEFGGSGNLSSTLQESNTLKSNKTSSIFSPDSKIPPQNIFSSLEKDKKNNSSTHRNHSSNKTSPNPLSSNAKKGVSTSILGTITPSSTSGTGSLFSPPLPKNIPSIPPRHRTPSSGSEPELIPVLTKLEETPGYENIIRERKIALNPTNENFPSADKEKKSVLSDKSEPNNDLVFGFNHKPTLKDDRSNDMKSNSMKNDTVSQPISTKPLANVKFQNEIRSDLGAVIYPTNPKSVPLSKTVQGFPLTEPKHSLSNSVSTVNLLGIEKMVDTSISPAKQASQFGAAVVKPNPGLNSNFNPSVSTVNMTDSSSTMPTIDQTEKNTDISLKSNSTVTGQEMVDIDGTIHLESKRSEKKKKKEKHKHKEKSKDKEERKKEKKKHKEKDRERSKEKERHKDKEKHREKEKYKEKEIDVVTSETPIKITIPKDKISGSLKFKISKEALKKEDPELKLNTSGELKIKISKDIISSIGTYKEESKSDSKKRERSPKSSGELPHPKLMKSSEKKSSNSSMKSNGTEGPSRNSSSHRYSVSENDSCFDISSLYDFPFEYEENGQGIIKTPDYDFEAINTSEFPSDGNTSPETKEIKDCDKNSHNELELTKDENCVAPSELEACANSLKPTEGCDVEVSCGDMTTDIVLKPISPLHDINSPEFSGFNDDKLSPKSSSRATPDDVNKSHCSDKKDKNLTKIKCDDLTDPSISLENCDVIKNYKTILDSVSRRCESEVIKQSGSPVSSEKSVSRSTVSANDDNNNKNNDSTVTVEKTTSKSITSATETENPNYYNKYFKKDGGSRIRTREDKRSIKGRGDEKSRFDDRQRYYDNRRYRVDYNDRDRREDRRYYRDFRDYNKDSSSQFYYERKDDRMFEYPSSQYFNAAKAENNVPGAMSYGDMSANGTPSVYQNCPQTKVPPQYTQICDSSVSTNPDLNVQYQYGYFNNYMYPNGGYRFYGNVPFVNMSLIQQQPIPPGTGDSVVQLEPPLPLEPPPDLPPPPETPPPLPPSHS